MDLKKAITNLQNTINTALAHNVSLADSSSREVYDFKEKKKAYYRSNIIGALKTVKSIEFDKLKGERINEFLLLTNRLDNQDLNELKLVVDKLAVLAEFVQIPKEKRLFLAPSGLPEEIADEVKADVFELEKCYKSKCYRSAVILCGRLLESALHRKYFETTGKDALEKSPGIGLGNLIKKLSDENVKFEPGLTQQIHLINQARIFSVHRKQEAFYPSKEQAYAIALYTIDVLNKIFGNKTIQ